jgi:DNA-binding IclR family transcriptional regulator
MRHYKKTRTNVCKILRVLKQAPLEGKDYMTVGEIAKGSGLHKWTVSRTLDLFMHPFIDMIVPEELERVGLKIKLVKLKNPDINEERVLIGLRVRL